MDFVLFLLKYILLDKCDNGKKKFEFKFKHVGIAVIGQYCSKRILNPAAEKLLKGILINWASVVFGPF